MSDLCDQTDIWFREYATRPDEVEPPDTIIAHIASCPHCRGALVATLAQLVDPTLSLPVDSEECLIAEEEIPAFFDYEQNHGPIAAARMFPQAWWHSITCETCAELYHMLHALAKEELPMPWQAGLVLAQPAKLELPHRQKEWINLKIFTRSIQQLLGLESSLGSAWGTSSNDDTMITEQKTPSGQIQVFLRREPSGVGIIIQTIPPIQGTIVLTIASTTLTTALDLRGEGGFHNLSEQLFTPHNSTEITIAIEPSASLS